MPEPIILVAVRDFATRVNDVDYAVRAGNTIMSDHPLAKAHRDMFRPAGDRVTFPTPGRVEAATSSPGEKRNR